MEVTKWGKGKGNQSKWRYFEERSKSVFHGLHYWQLVDKVRKHWIAMEYPMGANWEAEFQERLCAQNMEVDCAGRDPNVKRRKMTLKDIKRFLETMKNWDGKLVDQELADKRAKTCSQCPHNRFIPGCTGCNQLVELVTAIVGVRATPNDVALENCDVCLCRLKAKVHLPIGAFTGDDAEYPDHCWVASERDSQSPK